MQRIRAFIATHVPTQTELDVELAYQRGLVHGYASALEQAEEGSHLADLAREGWGYVPGGVRGQRREQFREFTALDEEAPSMKVTHGITVHDDGRIDIPDAMLPEVTYFEDDTLVLDDEALDAKGVAR